jgi:hypothetical protein
VKALLEYARSWIETPAWIAVDPAGVTCQPGLAVVPVAGFTA